MAEEDDAAETYSATAMLYLSAISLFAIVLPISSNAAATLSAETSLKHTFVR